MQMFGGFTSAETCDRKLEHRIRRQLNKARDEEVNRELQSLMVDMSIEVDGDNMPDISPVSVDVGSVDTSQSTSFSFTRSYKTIDSSDKTLKKSYRTPHQAETDATNKAIIQRRKDIAMTEATTIFFSQKQTKASTNLERKNLKYKSARRIVEEMKEKHGVEIHERLVRSYVTRGILVGEAMLKNGAPGKISDRAFEALKDAYVYFIKLQQAEGKKVLDKKGLETIINARINHLGDQNRKGPSLLNRLREATEHLRSDTGQGQDARRIAWSAYHNISKWFDVLKSNLIELGFGRAATPEDNVEGGIFFMEYQKQRIANLDESSFSLGGASGRAGGCPSLVFYDTVAPRTGHITNKSA
jgi:hypothetical protein